MVNNSTGDGNGLLFTSIKYILNPSFSLWAELLIDDFLALMQTHKTDFTLSFRYLIEALSSSNLDSRLHQVRRSQILGNDRTSSPASMGRAFRVTGFGCGCRSQL